MQQTDEQTAPQKKDPAQEEYEEGRKFLEKGDLAQAANAFHNALKGFEESGNSHGIANAADKLADVCLAKGNYSDALEHIGRAYAVCEQEEDQLSLISLRKKKAEAKTGIGEYDEAAAINLDLLDYYKGSINPQGTVDTLERLAEIYLKQGDRARAADTYRTVASIHANFKHQRHAERYRQKADEIEAGR